MVEEILNIWLIIVSVLTATVSGIVITYKFLIKRGREIEVDSSRVQRIKEELNGIHKCIERLEKRGDEHHKNLYARMDRINGELKELAGNISVILKVARHIDTNGSNNR